MTKNPIGLAFAVTMFLAGISLVVAGPLTLSMAACGILVISGISISIVLDSGGDTNQFSIYVIIIASAFISFIPTYIMNEALYGNPQFKWIKDVAIRFPTYLGSTSFRKANLQNATFEDAYLSNVDFRQADLTNTFWYMSEKLNTCRLEKTLLENDLVVDLVVTLNGKNKVYDNISMIGVNLEGVKLHSASLVNADFSDANLKGATLTGACIKDWNINSNTRFDNIICEYIYRGTKYTERYPVDHSKIFESGDFVRLIQQISGTLDLIFRDGINWKSLSDALQNLQDKYGYENVNVRSIEKSLISLLWLKLMFLRRYNRQHLSVNFGKNMKNN